MEYPYKTPLDYVQRNGLRYYPKSMAWELGIDDAHIYRARKGDFTPTFVKVLRDNGLIPPARRRCRVTGDVPPELREDMRAEAEQRGVTMGELIAEMWRLWKYPQDFIGG